MPYQTKEEALLAEGILEEQKWTRSDAKKWVDPITGQTHPLHVAHVVATIRSANDLIAFRKMSLAQRQDSVSDHR